MIGAHRRLEKKIDPATQSLSLADARRRDCPLIYVNQGFEKMTGYSRAEALGRNCRFLQGPDTDRETVRRIAAAVAAGEALIVDLLNYRKDGSAFWNRLSIRPVRNDLGEVTHFIGIQSDITRMRDLESQLHGYALELANAGTRSAHRGTGDPGQPEGHGQSSGGRS